MKLFRVGITAFASAFLMFPAQAQPAKGAPAAFERVREVTTTRFKDVKLAGDPEMRQLAQKLLDSQQREIDDLKQWQVRMRQPDYRAQPDQPLPGSGPLDRKLPIEVAQAPSAPAPSASAPAAAAQDLPMVSGKVEKVDAATGEITIDHGPIPNLDMDSMTMVFRAQDPAMLKAVKPRDKIRFTADRVNGQITVMKIQRGR